MSIKTAFPVKDMETIDRGELVVQTGEGEFVFPGNSSEYGLIAKFRHVEDPNCYPNCLPSVGFEDTVDSYKVPVGFKVVYRVDSPTRVIEWLLVKYLR